MLCLGPRDIVALTTALEVNPNKLERTIYTDPLRQVFHSWTWVPKAQEMGLTVTVVGKDLQTFREAIEAWDYFAIPETMNLLLIVLSPHDWAEVKHLEAAEYEKRKDLVLPNINGSALCTQGSNSSSTETEIKYMTPDSNWNLRISVTASRMIVIDSVWTKWLFRSQYRHSLFYREESSDYNNICYQTWFSNLCGSSKALEVSTINCSHTEVCHFVRQYYGEQDLISIYSESTMTSIVVSSVFGLFEQSNLDLF